MADAHYFSQTLGVKWTFPNVNATEISQVVRQYLTIWMMVKYFFHHRYFWILGPQEARP